MRSLSVLWALAAASLPQTQSRSRNAHPAG